MEVAAEATAAMAAAEEEADGKEEADGNEEAEARTGVEAEAEAQEGGARGGEGRGEEAELEEAAQREMAAAVALANQLDAHEHLHANLQGLPEGQLPTHGWGGAPPLPDGLSEATAASATESATMPTMRGGAAAFVPVPAPPVERVIDSRRWGRGWQYLVSRAGAADASWVAARDTLQPLIDDFEARRSSSGDPSADEQPSKPAAATGMSGNAIDPEDGLRSELD